MEAAKRSYARALKGSKKTNAERAKHRTRSKSALSRYLKRHPLKPVGTELVEAQYVRQPLAVMGELHKIKPTETVYQAVYPKTHVPKKARVRNNTVAKERAQRVANKHTRRLSVLQRKPSGVSSERRKLPVLSESHSVS